MQSLMVSSLLGLSNLLRMTRPKDCNDKRNQLIAWRIISTENIHLLSKNYDAMAVLMPGPCEGAHDDAALTDLAAVSMLPGLAHLTLSFLILPRYYLRPGRPALGLAGGSKNRTGGY